MSAEACLVRIETQSESVVVQDTRQAFQMQGSASLDSQEMLQLDLMQLSTPVNNCMTIIVFVLRIKPHRDVYLTVRWNIFISDFITMQIILTALF